MLHKIKFQCPFLEGYSSQKTSESYTGYKNCNDVTGPSKRSTFKSNFRRLQLPNSFGTLHKINFNDVTQDKISMSLFRRLQLPNSFVKLHRIQKFQCCYRTFQGFQLVFIGVWSSFFNMGCWNEALCCG